MQLHYQISCVSYTNYEFTMSDIGLNFSSCTTTVLCLVKGNMVVRMCLHKIVACTGRST